MNRDEQLKKTFAGKSTWPRNNGDLSSVPELTQEGGKNRSSKVVLISLHGHHGMYAASFINKSHTHTHTHTNSQ